METHKLHLSGRRVAPHDPIEVINPATGEAFARVATVDRAGVREALNNDGVPSTGIAPFGGLKQSGWGRELGCEGIEAFLEAKHVSLGVQA